MTAEAVDRLRRSAEILDRQNDADVRSVADAGPSGMTVEEWNEAARSEGIGARRRAGFGNIGRALKSKQLAHETMDRWYVTNL